VVRCNWCHAPHPAPVPPTMRHDFPPIGNIPPGCRHLRRMSGAAGRS
jgi:hypothetical protein